MVEGFVTVLVRLSNVLWLGDADDIVLFAGLLWLPSDPHDELLPYGLLAGRTAADDVMETIIVNVDSVFFCSEAHYRRNGFLNFKKSNEI